MIRLALTLIILACSASAQLVTPEMQTRTERFRLFNACLPILSFVETIDDEERAIGLTRAALQAAVESRLRAARLYTMRIEESDARFLFVSVNVVGRAVHIDVEFHKHVTDDYGFTGMATTWDRGMTGTHGGNSTFVQAKLSELMDIFLADYLRVNEEACESK